MTTINLQPTEKDDLYQILEAATPARPRKLTVGQYTKLTADERAEYDDERLDWLSTDLRFATPSRDELSDRMWLANARNRARVSGRWGVMVSGSSGMGKTTAAIALMKDELSRYARKNPDWKREKRIPIVYVEVPAGSSGKAMLGRFLHFLNFDNYDSWTLEKRTRVVVNALKHGRTALVVVDEFHNLVDRSAGHQETANVLKGLSNVVGATFLYSGINIHRSKVTVGETGQQIATRFLDVQIGKFKNTTEDDRLNWMRLIASFEDQLCLLNHKPGTLVQMSPYLYRRTGGSIGSLALLVLGGAAQLISRRDPGAETLTQQFLSTLRLDLQAQRNEESGGDVVAA